MKNHNLFAALRAAFPADLDAVAVDTDNGLRYSWRDLDRATAMMANLLASLGLPSGARVAVHADKSVEALMLYLATLRAGYVFLPLNPAYQKAELDYFIGNAEPSVLVCSARNASWAGDIARRHGTAHVFTLDDNRSGTLLERAAQCSDRHAVVHSTQDALAVILYTSGTTGRSKGAMLSHGNMLSNALVLREYWGWQPGDVLMHVLPIFHIHGLFVAVHAALLNGSRMIWLAKFSPQAVLQRLPEATVFMGVPTLYVRLLGEAALGREVARHVRLFISGSAPLLIDSFSAWKERTGHIILERYGMSETVMIASNPYAADARFGMQSERRGGTVGFPLPGVSVRIVDAAGKTLPPEEIGGIEVKGPSVFAGYWRMPEQTSKEFTADGYFKTGDVGKFDRDGYLSIVGRSKDLIISGGFNVYPAEIESCINAMEGVEESAVVGVPDPDFGEVGVALVIAKPGAVLDPAVIILSLKSTLANFKIPKRCHIVQELPRNAMGKVQKNVLRAHYATTK